MHHSFVVAAAFLPFFLAGCTTLSPSARAGASDEMKTPEPTIERLTDSVWLHTSYEYVAPWGPIISHGMVIKTEAGPVLIDTMWNDEQTNALLAMIETTFGRTPIAAIVTHAHNDKMGGMGALKAAGVPSYGHPLTIEDAPKRQMQPPTEKILADTNLTKLIQTQEGEIAFRIADDETGDLGVTIFYPGPGHTRDNIVVFHEQDGVLFGGCLIRPGGSQSLGNTADGDVPHWGVAVKNVADTFPDAKIVVPSHGAPGGAKLLRHTVDLSNAANE